jgi:surfactin synthase thioesterase subunit
LIADAAAAARELLKSTGLSPQRLLILGHSEGTIVAVETALRLEADSNATLGGLLLLGAQARPMEEMLRFQIASSDTSQTPTQVDLATKEALALIASTSEVFAPDGKPIAWYRQFLAAPANEQRLPLVHAKVTLFQGEADVQTPSEEAERFLRFRTQRINVHKYKGLGHGFSPPKDGRPTLGLSRKAFSTISPTKHLQCCDSIGPMQALQPRGFRKHRTNTPVLNIALVTNLRLNTTTRLQRRICPQFGTQVLDFVPIQRRLRWILYQSSATHDEYSPKTLMLKTLQRQTGRRRSCVPRFRISVALAQL